MHVSVLYINLLAAYNSCEKSLLEKHSNVQLHFVNTLSDAIDRIGKSDLVVINGESIGNDVLKLIEVLNGKRFFMLGANKHSLQSSHYYRGANPIDFDALVEQPFNLDMAYLNNMYGNDDAEKMDMLLLLRTEILQNLAALKAAKEEGNQSGIVFFAHKLKSKISILGIPCSIDCSNLELIEMSHPTWMQWYNNVIFFCSTALCQLNTLLCR